MRFAACVCVTPSPSISLSLTHSLAYSLTRSPPPAFSSLSFSPFITACDCVQVSTVEHVGQEAPPWQREVKWNVHLYILHICFNIYTLKILSLTHSVIIYHLYIKTTFILTHSVIICDYNIILCIIHYQAL